MEQKRLLSLVRQAVDEYGMIEDGDRIAVGISGGKDSLTLLYALNGLRQFYPKKFEIEAVTVDLGFSMDYSGVQELCDKLGVHYTVINTQIKKIVFDERKEKNPCSLCAKLRKGALNDGIKELGCNKVAYAHHKDDCVNTMLLSLIYEGRFQSLEPLTELVRSGITVIRPLIFVNEADIKGFMNKHALPVVENKCPADGATKREYVGELVKQINKESPGVRDRLFSAIEKRYEELGFKRGL